MTPSQFLILAPHLKPKPLLALHLAAGAGLLSGEILGLTTGAFDWEQRRVWIESGSARGHPEVAASRYVYPAAWTWTAIERRVSPTGPDRLLFPGKTPGVPLERLDRTIKRACRRAFTDDGQFFTLLDARAFHQAAMKQLGLPQAVVAGSLCEDGRREVGRARLSRWRKAQSDVARAWTQIDRPPQWAPPRGVPAAPAVDGAPSRAIRGPGRNLRPSPEPAPRHLAPDPGFVHRGVPDVEGEEAPAGRSRNLAPLEPYHRRPVHVPPKPTAKPRNRDARRHRAPRRAPGQLPVRSEPERNGPPSGAAGWRQVLETIVLWETARPLVARLVTLPELRRFLPGAPDDVLEAFIESLSDEEEGAPTPAGGLADPSQPLSWVYPVLAQE